MIRRKDDYEEVSCADPDAGHGHEPGRLRGDSGSGDAEEGGTSESGNPVVRIGVFEPQTGDNGAGGKQEILGMQYANYVQAHRDD